jgi:sugar lactone lactonase YvrE
VELGHTVFGRGFAERTDPAALAIGPTGLGFSPDGRLFVADILENCVAAIPNALFRFDSAGTASTVFHNGALNGPLGLAVAPNGDILTVNAKRRQHRRDYGLRPTGGGKGH